MTRHLSLKSLRLILAGVVALACALIAAGSLSAPADPPPAPPAAVAPPEQPRGDVLHSETVTLTPTGFEPSELSLPKKGAFLVVANRSGLDAVALRLTRDAGQRVFELEIPGEQLDWAGEFTAPPGQYVLTEAGHPDWACRITVSSQ
jgi:hypothetical protein